jgi:hypothetical protein
VAVPWRWGVSPLKDTPAAIAGEAASRFLSFDPMKRSITRLLILLACNACAREPVSWSEVIHRGAPAEPVEFPGDVRPPFAIECPASLRVATSEGSAFAAWWRTRADSSAVLMVSGSMHGGPWSAPIVADSTDRGAHGCGRHAPAIAADARSGYVHIAYFLEPPEGAGVFFAHSMDSASTFHAAVPIVFGRNPARVSVAADGDRVAVAYEDPNSVQPIIGIALSTTMGHTFRGRVRATSENGRARQPVVRLEGDSIRLWWSEYSPIATVSATRPMYRAGKWER